MAEPSRLTLGGRYVLGEVVSVDELTVTYKARDLKLGAERAAKVLHPFAAEDPVLLARFMDEALVLAGMHHPNIPRVFDTGHDGAGAWIVTDPDRGRTAASALAATGAFDAPEALRVSFMVVQALAAAHAKGVVHRDVRPANIWLSDGGQVALSGFLFARLAQRDGSLTQAGDTVGDPAYAAPEQLDDPRLATPSADLYSVGATLFHLLTGRARASGRGPLGEHELDGVLHELRRLLGRALHPVPAARYADAREMAVALAAAYDQQAWAYNRPQRGEHLIEEFDQLLAATR